MALPAPTAAPPDALDGPDDGPERAYAAEADPDHRRRLAQFFTPFPLAAFMARWVLDGPRAASLADPALGLGVFARAVAAVSPGRHGITGFEIDAALADRAEALLSGLPGRIALGIRREDYLGADWQARYDGILCNPPYLRFQDHPGREARRKLLEERMGLRLAGPTNLHCLFLLKSVHQMAEEGRAAYVMPWEFLNAGYGERVKAHLLGAGVLRHAVVFDSERGVFPGAVTTACVLLMERDGGAGEVAFHRASAGQDLEALYRERIAARPATARPAETRVIRAADLDAKAKWIGYWKGTSPAKYRNAVPLGEFATVLRGIATGSNAFFVLDEAGRGAAGLPADSVLPCVAKARDVEGPVFGPRDFAALRDRGRPVWLLDAEGRDHPAVRGYLEAGRRAGVHQAFLTRNRNPWYALENRPPAPLWVSVFNRGGGLKAVLNRAEARNLTAFHCLYPKPGAEGYLEALFAWLLTAAGRAGVRETAREYGAGLEKIEPKDLAGARVPDFSKLGRADREALRKLVAGLDASEPEAGAPGASDATRFARAADEIFRPYL